MACQQLDVARPGAFRQRVVDMGAGVDDGRDVHACVGEVEGGVPGAVVAGQNRGTVADLDAVAVEVGLSGAGQHDAGAVVAVEDQRAFDGALGEDHLAGADAPEAFARGVIGRTGQVVGQLLTEADHVLVVVADRRGAGQDPDVGQRVEFREGRGEPVPGAGAVDLDRGFGQECPAGFGVLVDEDNVRAGAGGGEGRGDTGRAGADDQDVAMEVAAGVTVGVDLGRSAAEAGGAADEGLVDAVPEGFRPHEGLVVEPGREQHVEPIIDRAEVEFQRWPAVLALGVQAGMDLLDGGAGVWLEAAGTAAGADQGVGFLGTGGQDAARAVVFEAAAHEVHAVGEQGRGDGVAFVAVIGLAVEGEGDGAVAVDPAAVLDAEFGHDETSGPGVSGRGSPAL